MESGGMPQAAAATAGPRRVRARSVWLSQLLLTAVVVVVALVVQTLEPEQLTRWSFTAGVSGVVVVTAATLVVPWARVPRIAVLAVPLLDIVAIGFMESDTTVYTSFLWVFPIVWIATHFALPALLSAGALIVVIVLVDAAVIGGDDNTLVRMIVVLLSLAFLGMSTFIGARQTRAFRTLLRRQAGKLQESLVQVRSHERRVTLTLDAIDAGILRLSATGEVLSVNETYLRLYGLDAAAPGGPGTAVEYSALRGEPLPAAQRPFARAAAGEVFEQERVWLFDGGGDWHAVSVSAHALPAVDDERPSTLLIVQDVTALIESERARERISAIVSHELRNPLTAVLGHAELLLEDQALPAGAREQLRVVESAAQRMEHLIDGILAREPGGDPPAHEPLDLHRVVTASVESFQPLARAGEVEVIVGGPDPVPMRGDAFRLRQVVDNLLSNAIKYTRPGGTVRVSCRLDGDRAVLTVTDTGLGIDAADLPRVFEPYFRAATARATDAGGTGLGMGIARSIVEAHRGTLQLASTAGVGTTATVTLPAGLTPPS